MEITPLAGTEQLCTYAQSHQLQMQTGLIGHLRADMGTDGTEFHSAWFDFRTDLKTDAFRQALDTVIHELREDGAVLSSRNAISAFRRTHPEHGIPSDRPGEFGMRINTADYAFLLRMNPNRGDYNLYCFCYKRDWLDQHLQRAADGVRFITPDYRELFRVADGDKIRIVMADGTQQDRTVRYIDAYHMELESGQGSTIYHICEFAERMQAANCQELIPLRRSLPEQCYSMLLETGKIVILKKGETGYYPAQVPTTTREEARELVEEYNGRLGITKAQVEAMKAGSMFGFQVPAADPRSYDERGIPIQNDHADRSERI